MPQYIQGFKYITIHHTAGVSGNTKEELPAIAKSIEALHKKKSYAENYKTGGEFGYSYASYHYLFALDGSYIQLHDTKYQRAHATDNARGSSSHNKHGIAIAIAGNMDITKPSEQLIEGISQLCASLEKKYGVSFMIRGHKETALYTNSAGKIFYPENTGVYYTACPGTFMGTSKSGAVKQIIDRTNEILIEKPWYESVTKSELQITNPQPAYLYDIDSGERVKTYLSNSIIGVSYSLGDYYLTQYSVSNKIKNGFKKSEWQVYDESQVTDVEKLRNEIKRLKEELGSLQNAYNQMSVNLEEKNLTIDELKQELLSEKRKNESLEIQMAEKKVIIERLENDIKKANEKVSNLEKSLETCSKVSIKDLTWSEIFSGVLAKLVGKKPE